MNMFKRPSGIHAVSTSIAMVVDIHGVHHETVPGGGPEGMQLLRLGGYPKFGAPCIPFDVSCSPVW